MNNIDQQYKALLQDILDNGVEKSDRTGTGTRSVFGRQIRHKMSDGFPLLTTKKMAWKSIVVELLWFLRGDTNIKFLVDNGCNIWNGDAYKNYMKWFEEQSEIFSSVGVIRHPWTKEQYIEQVKLGNVDADLSDLGPIYGKQWRQWQGYTKELTAKERWEWYRKNGGPQGETKLVALRLSENEDKNSHVHSWLEKWAPNVPKRATSSMWYDQIQRVLHLLKTDPDSRRMMVSAWNVGELDQMVLPPCHYGFQVYTRELSGLERWALCKNEIDVDDSDLYQKLDNLKIPTRAISLMWNQRSVDTPLGLPFNIASYGLLLMLLAKEVNMVPDELIGNLGDCHIYNNQIDGIKEQLTREPYPLPKVQLDFDYSYSDGYIVEWDKIAIEQIKLVDYQSHPAIKMPLSN